METLSIDGKKFVKASKLAKDYGYTADYIGQLCRAKKVDAKLVGRSWYVEIESLEDHRANRYKKLEPENTEPKKGFSVTIHSTPEAAAHKTQLSPTPTEAKKNSANEPISFVNKRFYDRIPKYVKPVSYDHDDSELIPASKPSPNHLEKPKEISISLADAEKVPVKAKPEKVKFETTERPEVKFKGALNVSDLPEESVTELPPPLEKEVKIESVASAASAPAVESETEPTVVAIKKPAADATSAPAMASGTAYIIPTRRADGSTGAIKDVTITRNPGSASSVFHRAVLTTATLTALLLVAVMLGFRTELVSTSKYTIEAISFSVDELKAAVYGSK